MPLVPCGLRSLSVALPGVSTASRTLWVRRRATGGGAARWFVRAPQGNGLTLKQVPAPVKPADPVLAKRGTPDRPTATRICYRGARI